MARRRATILLFSIVLVLSQLQTVAAAGLPGGSGGGALLAPVQPGLLDELRTGRASSFVVEFSATADLRAAHKITDHAQRGQSVVDTLKSTLASSQGKALGLVKGVKGLHAESFWLTNVLVVRADVGRGKAADEAAAARLAALAERLAKVSGVSTVRAEKAYKVIEPVKTGGPVPQADPGVFQPEWGIDKIRAPEAWDLGITGSGIVVATIDTGVEFDHEALVEHYRGNDGGGSFTHDYNWWDPTGICGPAPCDNAGHGTHTMGTIVGGDLDGPLPDIGVAPGATWIAAKGCADFGCSEADLISSGQFMLAPTDVDGNNPDPSKRPDIVSNSWGSDDPNDTFYLETVQAWRAAGIIPVFAAGNAGPGCGSAGSPGNVNEVISAGATDIDDVIADFSSRGPSPSGKISPNVSAPGVDVVSSVPGGGYAAFSGTSMATPHVAGAIALMLSSEPALAGNYDGVLDALNQTAIDRPDEQCGAVDDDLDPNFVYGEGRIDAKAAVDLVKTGGTLTGTVRDAGTNDPIAGARVSADDSSRTFATTTNGDGVYEIFLAAGTYAVAAAAFGYQPAAVLGVVIETDVTTTQDLALDALPRFTVSGTVTSAENGSPFAGASIKARGTPVQPAVSDASGNYVLILPIGTYSLEATADGCTDTGMADIESFADDVDADFALTRKIDAFGHACRAIAFDWFDAPYQTALYGDEIAGRLRLPFDFPFYEEAYGSLFISDNGYLNFLQAEQFFFFPSGIPSANPPNAAIYPLWQDLVIDDKSSIEYGMQTVGADEAFVIEFAGVRVLGGTARLTFEVKLWQDGTIDFLYGANPVSPGDGRAALVGIENPDGDDALQIAFLERVLGSNRAIRIETVPVGIVTGMVTDANDGEPIAGATISATPGHRSVRTRPDGTYELKLLGGFYQVTAVSDPYVSETVPAVVVIEGSTTSIDFSLDAATAIVDPTAIAATVEFGETTQAAVTLSNDGSADLLWTIGERDLGAILPDLPPAVAGVFGKPLYRSPQLPIGHARAVVNDFDPDTLPIVIDDPDDDSTGPVETLAVRAQSDAAQVAIAIDYGPTTPFGSLGGYIYLDVDQDPSTGLPPAAFFGLPSQDIGFDYFATLFDVGRGAVLVFDLNGDLTAEVPANVDGSTVSFAIPLDALGGDDGQIDVAMDNGTFGPEDWAPDVGHGSIQAFTDLPWVTAVPDAGTIGPNAETVVELSLGGPTLSPGEYRAQVVIVSNAPKQPQVPVDVTLTVVLPDAFGRVSGTISDVHDGEPLADASVVVHTSWVGLPLDLSATTEADGTWSVIGPEGSWPADVTAAGYLATAIEPSIVRGVTTGGADAALHRIQPHASVDGGPFSFILTEGQVGRGTLLVGNPGGHEDLEFEIRERGGPVFVAGHEAPVIPATTTTTRTAPAGHVAQRVVPSVSGAPSLILMDVLPWGSDAIQQVLGANGIPFDAAGSAEMGMLDLVGYQAIYVGNDQPQAFYDAFAANFDRFDDYAAGGGYLWFGGAAFGFENGNLDGFVLPGGLTISGPAYEEQNTVEAPDHPLMAGMPNPFSGTSASHVVFTNLPDGATVIASAASNGQPTLVEYEHGAGRILAVGQTVEFGWANGQDTQIVLANGVPYIESFVPFTDLPWLSITPTEGTIAPDGSRTLDVTVDSTGLEPGVYSGFVVVSTNDPNARRLQVPVTLVVPAYRQGINAGGAPYTSLGGIRYAEDRVYAPGSFGYVGASSTRQTGAGIAGTEDDPLYQRLRTGMIAYRFDVANGVYTVDLMFAELAAAGAGKRVFSVAIEGGPVLANLDVFALAGGQRVALNRSFSIEVTDGVLDITFLAQRGDKPIINAILVTHDPAAGGP